MPSSRRSRLAACPISSDKADMAQITSREQLEAWLKDKPADWAQVIAAHAALRVLPYEFREQPSYWRSIDPVLPLFRATSISWAAHNFPAQNMARAAGAAARAADTENISSAAAAAYAAATPAAAAIYAVATANAASIYGVSTNVLFWENISHDCQWLSTKSDAASATRHLTREKLWLALKPKDWNKKRISVASRLRSRDEGYDVWIEWYNRRIEGHDAAFDIPGDIHRAEDKAILARLANATDKDFWSKDATYVNTTLQGWIDEARERVRPDETLDEPPPSIPETIRTIAAEIASPTITLTNNQLDVITNATFDGQTDTTNLDEAIAVLRAVVAALLGGLPGNAPRSFAANLTIYDAELAKRDAKPFLGVLVRMEKSVSAGFHAEPELFDVGVATNFESYFDAHQDFMTHYRRNEEREAKIAQFTVDDAAASGIALTDPVDEVAKEVEALAEQGLVTDSYVQAVKEQQEINNQIALYSSSPPTISGEPTGKERHILQIVGFFERTLAVTTNIVSVTTQFAAFIIVLKAAIEALLKFFV
jgi:hypothetical protein